MYREEIILPLVVGKEVLDCGGVDHFAQEAKLAQGTWLHAQVAARAASCLGVDILDENVQRINRQGTYKFFTANVENLPFHEEFDVVLAGELVEHIYNMGMFLDSAWRSLRPSGTLIITTPNRFGVSTSIASFLLGKERCHPEHTCYYSPQTLSYIVSKHGFVMETVALVDRPARNVIVGRTRSFITHARPILADQLIAVATKMPSQAKYVDKW